jgi:hypothetical protein
MTAGEARDDLTRFLCEQKQALGVTFRHLAVKAVDPETKRRLVFQWLDRLANHQIAKAPEPWQLRALAAALSVDADVVKALAALQWLEYEPRQLSLGDPWNWALWAQAKGLPEDEQELLNHIVVGFLNRQSAQRQAQDGAAGIEDGEDGAAHG